MIIGVVQSPHHWEHWEQARAYLEPARARGDFATVLEPDEELFAVLDGDELLAVATAWFDVGEMRVEVKLVGGREHRRWLKQLNDTIGAAAREAGATRLIAWGRAGWIRPLREFGWEAVKLEDGGAGYQRALTSEGV